MKLTSERDALMEAWRASLADALPERVVRRGLVEPADLPQRELEQGVLCLVAQGGGSFANWLGREGELGTARAAIVGFVQVGERAPAVEAEQAELALLEDVLTWCGLRKQPPLDCVYPLEFVQSGGLERPIGWFTLNLEARNV